ncbi:hypothetical protein G0Q06_03070 [Puniceicoccales bacterium CK1056]|uniref:Tetratricopeptide repeat protein n=1 Tax=Oceanipulchritudo coccoides TaxID=2706888 RepID=A0A6B2LZR3_9BACT|nr:hypothetical protein [Oceanipulchritudo coccoides]NDV61424.1 hypothetical protein [Oceanipulchritudo coccoides]
MRIKTIRKALIGIGLLLCAAVLLGWLFRSQIRDVSNKYRSERLFAQAEAAFLEEDWANATRLGTAAHYLDTRNSRIDLLVARALLKQRDPSSVVWWERVLDQPDLPVDELRTVTRAILRQGKVEVGLPFLNRLVQADGDNPETQRLWLYSLARQGRMGSAEAYAEQVNLPITGQEPEPSYEVANLSLAVATADAGETNKLASLLSRKGEWALLQQLMERQLAEDPDNPEYLVKLIGAYYYAGNPTPLAPLVERLAPRSLETQPVWESFVSYLRLLIDGYEAEHHQRLESLLASYPEIFEYRLVLGLSFLLNGQQGLAQGLARDMPDVPLSTARHLRVLAMLLGMPGDELLRPEERDQLLPRERYLMSLHGVN